MFSYHNSGKVVTCPCRPSPTCQEQWLHPRLLPLDLVVWPPALFSPEVHEPSLFCGPRSPAREPELPSCTHPLQTLQRLSKPVVRLAAGQGATPLSRMVPGGTCLQLPSSFCQPRLGAAGEKPPLCLPLDRASLPPLLLLAKQLLAAVQLAVLLEAAVPGNAQDTDVISQVTCSLPSFGNAYLPPAALWGHLHDLAFFPHVRPGF